MSNPFKIGDVVECVLDDRTTPSLKLGKNYIVTELGRNLGTFIVIEGIDDYYFHYSRFKLVKRNETTKLLYEK